jgi:hypothetical protein
MKTVGVVDGRRDIKRNYIHKSLPNLLELELEEGSCGDGISFAMQLGTGRADKLLVSFM